MRDIVATIQPDQDDLVRADFDHSLCIQGAPGTGKTAVGLHRAAYLLYTFPARLRRSGVLVVGPNAAFLHYVAEVLPTLGEVGVAQATVDELVAGGLAPRAVEGRARWRPSRATPGWPRSCSGPCCRTSENRWRTCRSGSARRATGCPVSRLRRYVDDIRRSGVRWEVARERLHAQIATDVRRQQEDAGFAPSDAATAAIARSASVRGFVNEHWPALTPAGAADPAVRRAGLPARVRRGRR